ncbi:hypothetical protein [Leifsonia tongyongensis]|uniref:DUF7882 family protein n=1 Tax=Leifsonia tongyongensis TaxID=1268043 RepID=UPI001F046347|nr:hypothetical protein [Diaminobutyricibacter tongyongensis]
MGILQYGSDQYEFDDRLLAHMKLAIVAKLLRHESFLLNWTIPAEKGSGRISLWISRESHLTFRFAGSRPPNINPRWVEALSLKAARTGGMQVISEDEVDAAFAEHRDQGGSGGPLTTQGPS